MLSSVMVFTERSNVQHLGFSIWTIFIAKWKAFLLGVKPKEKKTTCLRRTKLPRILGFVATES